MEQGRVSFHTFPCCQSSPLPDSHFSTTAIIRIYTQRERGKEQEPWSKNIKNPNVKIYKYWLGNHKQPPWGCKNIQINNAWCSVLRKTKTVIVQSVNKRRLLVILVSRKLETMDVLALEASRWAIDGEEGLNTDPLVESTSISLFCFVFFESPPIFAQYLCRNRDESPSHYWLVVINTQRERALDEMHYFDRTVLRLEQWSWW